MAFKKKYFSNLSNGVNRSALKQEANPERKPSAEMTDEEIKQARANIDRLKSRQDTERTRVDNVRSKVGEVLKENRNFQDNAKNLVPEKDYEFVQEVGSGCNTFSCAVLREAGATVPEDSDFNIYKGFLNSEGDAKYKKQQITGGMEMPIIPGNEVFDKNAEALGFTLQPAGTHPSQSGDLIRVNYDLEEAPETTIYRGELTENTPEDLVPISGTYHAALTGDEGQGYYNSGIISEGIKQNNWWSKPENFDQVPSEAGYKDTDRVMRYTGNTPKYTKEYRDADKKLSNYFSQRIQKGMAKSKTGIKTQGFSLMSKEEMTKGAKKSLLGNK
jgi:hypothetical protein|tara:strand:+ start:2301 stop:3290 length:990 start_codon:yes stop_codon:yes gene_type:complete